MYSSAFLAFAAFVFGLLLTPAIRSLSLRLGIVDRPDSKRKMHLQPTARIGGIAICLSYLAAFAVLLSLPLGAARVVREDLDFIAGLAPAAAVALLTGLWDDVRPLRPWQKLTGQTLAAVLACMAGVKITGIAGYTTDSWWSWPVTILWLVACANAFNLIDGMDGLAAGLGLAAATTMFGAALLQNNVPLALATAPLAGCLLAFLRYNFNPASIFLGDCGSMLIGFLLGSFGVIWSHKSATLLGMTAPVMAVSIPLLDTSLAMLRRFLRQRPIFSADRGHIHHQLLDKGLTPRRAAFLLYSVGCLAAGFSLLAQVARQQYAGLILLLFCACIVTGIHALGFVEIDVMRQMLFRRRFRQTLDLQIGLRQFENLLRRAPSLDECWSLICDSARQFGLTKVQLETSDERREVKFGEARPGDCWQVRVSLPGGWIDFEHNREDGGPRVMAPFIDLVTVHLQRRLGAPEPVTRVMATSVG